MIRFELIEQNTLLCRFSLTVIDVKVISIQMINFDRHLRYFSIITPYIYFGAIFMQNLFIYQFISNSPAFIDSIKRLPLRTCR